MTPHTPGPWRIEEHYAPELGRMAPTPYIVDAGGQNVAAALLMVPEQDANARLIAAAPALLAALERIMAALPDGAVSVGMAAEILSARAALRAATGDPS